MIKRILISAALAVFSNIALTALPYFPNFWVLVFSLAVAFISYYTPVPAMALVLSACGISLAYHSMPLGALYFVLALVLMVCGTRLNSFSEGFLLIMSAPLLARLGMGDSPLPLEFLVIFLTPFFIRGKASAVIPLVACLWCLFLGLLNEQNQIGNLIIGREDSGFFQHGFYFSRPRPVDYYHFDWIAVRLRDLDFEDTKDIVVQVGNFVVRHPVILLQALLWTAAGLVLAFFLVHSNRSLRLMGLVMSSSLIVISRRAALALEPMELPLQSPQHTFLVFSTALAAWSLWEVLWTASCKRQEKMPAAAADGFGSPENEIGAHLFRKDLSLEESLKVQKLLQQYIKEKFVRDVTALDIDVVDSAKLKLDESPDNVLLSFTEYWKAVDQGIRQEEGRMLNRSGDGAMYVFDDADRAVRAAKDILKRLHTFNAKVNVLKNYFAVRIGLNTGEMLADTTRKKTDVFSEVLDLAGHLQKQAPPDHVLISEHTFKKIKNQLDFRKSHFSADHHITVYELKENT